MKGHAPATLRNRDALASVLREVLPKAGLVLEVASGTGEHAIHFAGLFPEVTWQPSDPEPEALASISAWRADAALANLLTPVRLDASAAAWPVTHAEAILCVNMVHISPWKATLGLLRGAERLLSPGAPLILYGPYRRAGVPTAPSNETFDESLRSRNPAWGLRDLDQVAAAARAAGLALEGVTEMPANNLTVIFRRIL